MQRIPTILVVDDDASVRRVTAQTLAAAGYDVKDVGSGAEALDEAERWSPAMVVLDVSMPGMDGYAVVKELRSRGYGRPVLMLPSHDSSEHIVRGLSAGADDYVTKPFDLRVLAARVHALLRRGPTLPMGAGKLYFGDTVVDLDLKQALCAGETVPLTRTEYALLTLLARNGAKPTTRGEILEGVWGYTGEVNTRTVETHLWRLRKKLGDDGEKPHWILTRTGLGYVLALETLNAPALAAV
jgi:DNA-binding response OmpR family regulator